MQRAQNRLFSLSANGGFTFKNQETKTNTVDVGLDGTYKGVTLGFKTNIPIEKLTIHGNKTVRDMLEKTGYVRQAGSYIHNPIGYVNGYDVSVDKDGDDYYLYSSMGTLKLNTSDGLILDYNSE